MENKDKLQEKYIEFQMLDQQIKQASGQVQELNTKLMELEYIKMSLDEIKDIKKGSEILAPLSSGIFIRAEFKGSRELLVNVGGNTVVAKNISETKQLIDSQLEEVGAMREKLLLQVQELTIKARTIEQALSKLAKEGE